MDIIAAIKYTPKKSYLFTIWNQIESVFLKNRDAYICVYKNKAPKTSRTTFNEAIYCSIFKC